MKFCWERMAERVYGGSAYESKDAVYDSGTTDWLKKLKSLDVDLRDGIDEAEATDEIKGAFYAYVMNKMPLGAISETFQIEQSKLLKMMRAVFDQIMRMEKL